MPRTKHITARQGVLTVLNLKGEYTALVAEAKEIKAKPGDARFINAVRRIGQGFVESMAKTSVEMTDPQELRLLRSANRGRNSGPSRFVGVKMKADAYPSVETRAEELGLSVSEYIRALIATDIGVVA